MKEESIVSMIEKEADRYLDSIEQELRDVWEKGDDFFGMTNRISQAYIAGRSKSIESEKAKDERIKELENGLKEILHISDNTVVHPDFDKIYNISNKLLKSEPIEESEQDELMTEFITKVNNYIQFGGCLEEIKKSYHLIKK